MGRLYYIWRKQLKKKKRRRLNKKPVDILDDQNIDKNKVGKWRTILVSLKMLNYILFCLVCKCVIQPTKKEHNSRTQSSFYLVKER